jgi:hypothetical protein
MFHDTTRNRRDGTHATRVGSGPVNVATGEQGLGAVTDEAKQTEEEQR